MFSNATLAIGVYVILQLAKPFLTARLMPQDKAWQNMAYRALGFAVAFALVVLNVMAQHALSWSAVWGLLPTAGAVWGVAVATYHLSAPAATPTSTTTSNGQ